MVGKGSATYDDIGHFPESVIHTSRLKVVLTVHPITFEIRKLFTTLEIMLGVNPVRILYLFRSFRSTFLPTL